jgi:hypothetical protein
MAVSGSGKSTLVQEAPPLDFKRSEETEGGVGEGDVPPHLRGLRHPHHLGCAQFAMVLREA